MVSPEMRVRPFDSLFLRGGLSDRNLLGGYPALDPLVPDQFVIGVLQLTCVELSVDEEIHHQHSTDDVVPRLAFLDLESESKHTPTA